MDTCWKSIAFLGILLGLALPFGHANAQATRTWVSGVGDDANPCSRTAPCKTFAGAISKTAAGGEISVLDPGGFGGVTITKSISIVADGAEAGVLVAGTNGIIINAGAGDKVNLTGLVIDGTGTGLNGIRFIAGASLSVNRCIIKNFTTGGSNGWGIQFAPATVPSPAQPARLYVTDTIITNNGSGSAGGGIQVRPGAAGVSAEATINVVSVQQGVAGIKADGNGASASDRVEVLVRDSAVSGNTGNGLFAVSSGAGATTILFSDRSASSNNAVGVQANGAASAQVMLNDSAISGNTTGLFFAAGGQILSYQNNHINGNSSDGAPSGTLSQN